VRTRRAATSVVVTTATSGTLLTASAEPPVNRLNMLRDGPLLNALLSECFTSQRRIDLNAVSLYYSSGLCLNPSKSDIILFGAQHSRRTLSPIAAINIAGVIVSLFQSVTTLGVILDQPVNLQS